MKIVVFGAGLVGGPMAVDLAAGLEFVVTLADRDRDALERWSKRAPLQTVQADLARPEEIERLAQGHDLVVSAVPGHMGFSVLQTLLAAGKPVVDIAFFPEDPFLLAEEAQRRGVTAVVDCGVAPGLSHILAAYGASLLDEAERIEIYVGGLPRVRTKPWEYKAVFSPADVIEEYIRPARLVENGRMVVKPALSEPEWLEFPGVGTLEAFNSDGLRTLVHTTAIPFMKEKTLRYPGYVEKVSLLRDLGLFSSEPVQAGPGMVRPIDLTSALLFPQWKLQEGEGDLTVMKVRVCGITGGERVGHEFDLLDFADERSGIHSMARTTGYTATGVARLLLQGKIKNSGLVAPERLGLDHVVCRELLAHLAQRGVAVRQRTFRLPG